MKTFGTPLKTVLVLLLCSFLCAAATAQAIHIPISLSNPVKSCKNAAFKFRFYYTGFQTGMHYKFRLEFYQQSAPALFTPLDSTVILISGNAADSLDSVTSALISPTVLSGTNYRLRVRAYTITLPEQIVATSASAVFEVRPDVTAPVFDALIPDSLRNPCNLHNRNYNGFVTMGSNVVSTGWSITSGAGTVPDTTQGIVNFSSQSGPATLTVRNNGCGLSQTDTLQIYVRANVLAPTISPSIPPGFDTVCQFSQNKPYRDSVFVPDPNADSTSLALQPSAAGTIVASDTINFAQNFSGFVTLTATSAGCGAGQATSFQIYVKPNIDTARFASASDTFRCAYTLSHSYPLEHNATFYHADGITYTQQSASSAVTINAATGHIDFDQNYTGPTKIVATLTYSNGCNLLNRVDSAVEVVHVRPAPTVPVPQTFVADDSVLCLGNSSIYYSAFSQYADTLTFKVDSSILFNSSSPVGVFHTYMPLALNNDILMGSDTLHMNAAFFGLGFVKIIAKGCGTADTILPAFQVAGPAITPIISDEHFITQGHCVLSQDTIQTIKVTNINTANPAERFLTWTVQVIDTISGDTGADTLREVPGTNRLTTFQVHYPAGFAGIVKYTATYLGCNGQSAPDVYYYDTIRPHVIVPTVTTSMPDAICQGIYTFSNSINKKPLHTYVQVASRDPLGNTQLSSVTFGNNQVNFSASDTGKIYIITRAFTGCPRDTTGGFPPDSFLTDIDTITLLRNPVIEVTQPNPVCEGSTLGNVLISYTEPADSVTYSVSIFHPGTTGLDTTSISASDSFLLTSHVFNDDLTTYDYASIALFPTAHYATFSCPGKSDTLIIPVVPKAKVTNASNDTLCDGTPYTISSFTSSSDSVTYTWAASNYAAIGLSHNTGNTGVVPSDTAQLQDANANVSSTATITIHPKIEIALVDTNYACQGEVDSFKITVNPLPYFQGASLDTTICSGEMVVLNDSTTQFPDSIVTYGWTRTVNSLTFVNPFGDTTGSDRTINRTLTLHTDVSTKDSAVYNWVIRNTITQCTNYDQQSTVIVKPKPAVGAVSKDLQAVVCGGSNFANFRFSPNSTNDSLHERWTWLSDPGDVVADTDGRYNLISFSQDAATSMVMVRSYYSRSDTENYFGCFADTSIHVTNTGKVLGNDETVSVVKAANDNSLVALANNVQSYMWGTETKLGTGNHPEDSLKGAYIPGATAQNYYPQEDPDFMLDSFYIWVEVTFKNSGCVQKAYYRNAPGQFATSVENVAIALQTALAVYPNPANDWLHVDFGARPHGKVAIQITDLSGRVVAQEAATNQENVVNVASLMPGYYMVICSENGLRIGAAKFVKY